MAAGAICANTLKDETEDLSLQQLIEFLEPQVDRGPALCMSTEDFAKLQIAMEQACAKLAGKCTKEQQEQIKQVSARVGRLVNRRKPRG